MVRVTNPRANSHPSGDSAMFTVTERAGRRAAGPVPEGEGASLGPMARSRNSRVGWILLIDTLLPRLPLQVPLATAAKL